MGLDEIARRQHRMPGAQAFLLDRRRMGADRCGQGVHAVAHDHHRVIRADAVQGRQHMADHGAARDGVQDLGQVRFHAGAQSGGQNHRGCRRFSVSLHEECRGL